jgi:DNA polymerase III epsilon subunit-like protein
MPDEETSIETKDTASRVTGAMRRMDLVFVDTETTGLDPRKHELLEIAFVRVQQDWSISGAPVFTIVEEWSAKVLPENIQSADPASLRVNGYTVTAWNGAVRIQDALKIFSDKTEGAIMVAHNVAFDASFLDTAFSTYGVPNKMHYHRLDTVSMAYAKLNSAPEVTRYSLAELCKHFGIVNENAHSALADTRACFELFERLMKI